MTMNQPLKNLLIGFKSKMSEGILIRAYMLIAGKKIGFYQGVIMVVLAGIETLRQFEGFLLYQQLLRVFALGAGMFYMWVYGSAGGVSSSVLNDALWMADIVEKDVSPKLERRNRRIARLACFYFWSTFFMTVLTLLPMIALPLMEGTTVLPMPSCNADVVGDLTESICFWGTNIWQCAVVILTCFAYSWVDGVQFGAVLMIYAFTKLLAESLRRVIISEKRNMANLIRAHQILVHAADVCNQCMSVTNCVLVIASVYLSVLTGYSLITENASIDRILDMILSFCTILRLGFMSELMKEASFDVGAAVYESPWINGLFPSNEANRSQLRLSVILITMKAQKDPMHIKAGFMGALGNTFSMKYCRALYSYFQALENIF